jgi:hypothetical protein
VSNGGTIYWRIQKLEKDAVEDRKETKEAIQRLEEKVDRLTMTIIGFALTVAASAAAAVLLIGPP